MKEFFFQIHIMEKTSQKIYFREIFQILSNLQKTLYHISNNICNLFKLFVKKIVNLINNV